MPDVPHWNRLVAAFLLDLRPGQAVQLVLFAHHSMCDFRLTEGEWALLWQSVDELASHPIALRASLQALALGWLREAGPERQARLQLWCEGQGPLDFDSCRTVAQDLLAPLAQECRSICEPAELKKLPPPVPAGRGTSIQERVGWVIRDKDSRLHSLTVCLGALPSANRDLILANLEPTLSRAVGRLLSEGVYNESPHSERINHSLIVFNCLVAQGWACIFTAWALTHQVYLPPQKGGFLSWIRCLARSRNEVDGSAEKMKSLKFLAEGLNVFSGIPSPFPIRQTFAHN